MQVVSLSITSEAFCALLVDLDFCQVAPIWITAEIFFISSSYLSLQVPSEEL